MTEPPESPESPEPVRPSADRSPDPPRTLFLPGCDETPWRTAALPGLGGRIGPACEDFRVEEIPAYPPSGEGPHFFVEIEKRNRSTPEVRDLLARAAGVRPMDVGFAGRKDALAIARQWFSLPCPPVDPGVEGLSLGTVTPHRNKLRIGHLRGNRFQIRLVGLDPEAEARFPALASALAAGLPNYYGEQRFGRGAHNVAQALDFLANPRRRVRDPEFLASVFQSAIFNRWLGDRIRDGLLDDVVVGDVLRRRETGGLFVSAEGERETDAARVAAAEIDATGPMPGGRMFAAAGPAAERDQAALAAFAPSERQLETLARFAPGTRRPARIPIADLSLDIDAERPGEARVSFTLPAGSFATILLGELCRPTADRPLREATLAADGD